MAWHILDAPTAQDPYAEFALDVLTGLSENPKQLSSKWFYDDAGSRLFRAIMGLEEYYPTRCEREILLTHGASIAARFAGQELDVVDLGAGDGAKTELLLRELTQAGVRLRYVPVDISPGAMTTLEGRMAQALPKLELRGVVGDYVSALLARARSQLDEVIGRPYRLLIMLDDHDGVAKIAKRIESAEQSRCVGRVQAGGRLIEHVEHA